MENQTQQYDLEMLSRVVELFEVEKDNRDSEWIAKFLEVLPTASFGSFDQQISNGPDGFPYFGLRIPEPFEAFEQYSVLSILDFACNSGVGISIFDTTGECQWVLSFGDLWNYRESGTFFTHVEKPDLDEGNLNSVLVASPSEKYLPSYVREILVHYTKPYFTDEPLKACLILSPNFSNGSALAFNIFPENYAPDTFEDCMVLLTWLLPKHYVLMVLPDGSETRDDLKQLILTKQH